MALLTLNFSVAGVRGRGSVLYPPVSTSIVNSQTCPLILSPTQRSGKGVPAAPPCPHADPGYLYLHPGPLSGPPWLRLPLSPFSLPALRWLLRSWWSALFFMWVLWSGVWVGLRQSGMIWGLAPPGSLSPSGPPENPTAWCGPAGQVFPKLHHSTTCQNGAMYHQLRIVL